ncbi:MAG: protoporphyrinogen oxidase-like protein [Deltaproteobacteria bacterium]|nr:protoporphyrinogen oxidase-like protein [Deltaproteobacteria bacterium]
MEIRDAILGAGMTGLAAGIASYLPVYEANEVPGGICSSYYMQPGSNTRLYTAPEDDEAYRFEIGGGHWLHSGDSIILRFIRSFTPVKSYLRKSAVYLPGRDLLIPYPIQYNLRYLGSKLAAQALQGIFEGAKSGQPTTTMSEWLRRTFGPTLCELFFDPFHELYTAGLWNKIAAPYDGKTPMNLELAIQGAFGEVPAVGYNVNFVYPKYGLNTLAQRMGLECDVRYRKRVVKIDRKDKLIYFEDGEMLPYRYILSTLPLNQMIEMTDLDIDQKADPYVSVLVINLGAVKGRLAPEAHWVYVPRSEAGFHRVGFYSNVDTSFLPASSRKNKMRVSIYVEKSYPGGQRPNEDAIRSLCRRVVDELQEWEWITEAEVVDPTWIDVAYTWSWPGSKWVEKALIALESHDIHQMGRYATWASGWKSQGIVESIRKGLTAYSGEVVR